MLHILEKTGRKLTITLLIAKDLRVNSGKSVEKILDRRKGFIDSPCFGDADGRSEGPALVWTTSTSLSGGNGKYR